MKHRSALILVLVVMLLLTACGSPEPAGSSGPVDTWPDEPEFTELSEADFLAAVEESSISVHAKGGLEFKFYLDMDLNVLAVRAYGDDAHMVLGCSYVTTDASYETSFWEIYGWAEELGALGSLNGQPLVVDAVFETAGEGIEKILFAPFDELTSYYADQTFQVTEGTVTAD